MSLYSDLNEILTPYAQKIKGLAAANDKVKADLDSQVESINESLGDSIRFDIVQNKTEAEKHQSAENSGVIDLNIETLSVIDSRFLAITDALATTIRVLAKSAYLDNNSALLLNEVTNMFNLIENKYAYIHGLRFTFPASADAPLFAGLGISTQTSTKRGVILSSLSNGSHAIKDSSGNDTPYYPIPIPKGATMIFSRNNAEKDVAVCYHILRYNNSSGDYDRAYASDWHYCNIANDGPYIFNIGAFGDGNHYVCCGVASSNSEAVIEDRNAQNVYVGVKTRAPITDQVLTENDLKSLNITII